MKTLTLLLVSLFTGVAFSQNNIETQEVSELRKIADQLRGDDDTELLNALKPSKEDLSVIFQDQEAQLLVATYIKRIYARLPIDAVKPKEHQTALLVLSVNSDDLKAQKQHDMPGGYNWIKDRFNSGITIYGVKFVEPGNTIGYSLNSFYYVNNHWVCIPKVYRAFPQENTVPSEAIKEELVRDTPEILQLKTILNELRGSDDSATLKKLRPADADLRQIFKGEEIQQKLIAHYNRLYENAPMNAIKPQVNQTDYIIRSALSNDLKERKPHPLPGGYDRIRNYFNDDVIIYAVKYVEPGGKLGYSLDGFFYINNRWMWLPKSYLAFPNDE